MHKIYLKRFYLHLKQCIFYFIIAQAKDSNLRKLAYGGSLGRLNHHGRTPLQMRAHHHNHHGSTTLSNQLFKTTAAAVWIQSTKCKKEDLTFYCHENNVLSFTEQKNTSWTALRLNIKASLGVYMQCDLLS